jgi:hypothetical protein
VNERPRVARTNAVKSLRLAEDQDFQDRESQLMFSCAQYLSKDMQNIVLGGEMQARILKIMEKEDREFTILKSRCSKIALIQGHMSRTFSTADSGDTTLSLELNNQKSY